MDSYDFRMFDSDHEKVGELRVSCDATTAGNLCNALEAAGVETLIASVAPASRPGIYKLDRDLSYGAVDECDF